MTGAWNARSETLPAKSRAFAAAIGWHAAIFAALALWGIVAAGKRAKGPEPIELTFVAFENPDGVDDEPPPLEEPAPPPPSPKEIVKPVEVVAENPPDAVVKTPEEKKPRVETPKPPEKPKETREERLKRMRESTRKVTSKPRPNGRTEGKKLSQAEIQRLLNLGYRPGRRNNLAASEAQRCYSLIRRAFHEHWSPPPWTDSLGTIQIEVSFGPGGRVSGYRIVKSSGDGAADATVRSAAAHVRSVAGLSHEFLSENPTVVIEYEVRPE